MTISFDFPPLSELPVQRAFLQALVPGLASIEQIKGIWLTGSLARGNADRWSSVDLYLAWWIEDSESKDVMSPLSTLKDAVDEALGAGNALYDQFEETENSGCMGGISLRAEDTCDPLRDIGRGGVLFELSWTTRANEEFLERGSKPLRLLYFGGPSESNGNVVETGSAPFGSPDTRVIGMQLRRFWLLLARLPAVVRRQEHLAAHALLTEVRMLLIDLVVALNGAGRPQTSARINQYLGPAQRNAFEKSLGYGQSTQRGGDGDGFNWIGQAVALVVLYRWYAPQLTERHALPYPKHAEETVLALLSGELENWPSNITTG